MKLHGCHCCPGGSPEYPCVHGKGGCRYGHLYDIKSCRRRGIRPNYPDGQKADLLDGVIYTCSSDMPVAAELEKFLTALLQVYVTHDGLERIYGPRSAFRLSPNAAACFPCLVGPEAPPAPDEATWNQRQMRRSRISAATSRCHRKETMPLRRRASWRGRA